MLSEFYGADEQEIRKKVWQSIEPGKVIVWVNSLQECAISPMQNGIQLRPCSQEQALAMLEASLAESSIDLAIVESFFLLPSKCSLKDNFYQIAELSERHGKPIQMLNPDLGYRKALRGPFSAFFQTQTLCSS
ncbi:MAG: hypothetical protein I8H75_03550 [Myxococcaceae bacterium]|nr:hypothetical protein [Myxococcaceae bacterium]